jgi:hypothetical protein
VWLGLRDHPLSSAAADDPAAPSSHTHPPRPQAAAPATRAAARRVVVVRAEAEKKEEIHFGGQAYTPAEWDTAKATGNLPTAEPVPVAAAASGSAPVSFGSLMAFSGGALQRRAAFVWGGMPCSAVDAASVTTPAPC